jgi:UDP-N-acetylglucosamine--N-acetylmuramyl-(pentapeptide) pyrophosphoryl-undecaprenol N-acetylglucosamine transferase
MTGGGSLGPFTPLIAVEAEWQQVADIETDWIITPKGPERQLLEEAGIEFDTLVAPKFSRHKWWQWPFIPLMLTVSTLRAYALIKKLQPHIMYTLGGYVSVPVAIACKVLGIPIWVHQLDVEVGLANKVMAPLATRVSTTFKESLSSFREGKAICLGGISRFTESNFSVAPLPVVLNPEKKTLLVTGGGTGSKAINDAIEVIVDKLESEMNVIHLTGAGKLTPEIERLTNLHPDYHAFELVSDEMYSFLSNSDLVATRAGLGILLNLVEFAKPAIFIPLTGQQEANADLIFEHEAGVVMRRMTAQLLLQTIKLLMNEPEGREQLSKNIGSLVRMDAARHIVQDSERLIRDLQAE